VGDSTEVALGVDSTEVDTLSVGDTTEVALGVDSTEVDTLGSNSVCFDLKAAAAAIPAAINDLGSSTKALIRLIDWMAFDEFAAAAAVAVAASLVFFKGLALETNSLVIFNRNDGIATDKMAFDKLELP